MVRAFRSLLPLALAAAALPFAAAAYAQRDGGDAPPIQSGVMSQASTAAVPKPPPPPVPVNVLAVPFPISGAVDDQIALLVEAGGKALLANVDSGNLVGEIKASATDSTGKVVDEFTQPFALDASDELLQRGGLKLFAVLRVAPGDYKVDVSVVNSETRGHGVKQVSVHAPDFARREAALSPPLFADRADRWRVFRQSDSPHEDLPFPFVDAQGGGFLPSASPAVPPQGGELVVYAYGPLIDAQQVTAKLVGADGKAIPARASVIDSAQGKFVIQRRLLMKVEGPLPEGSHRLEVTLADSAGGHSTSTPLAVLDDVVLAQMAKPAAAASDEPEQPVDEPPALPDGWTRAQLAERHRQVLARAATGDLDGAAHDLAELELQATPKRSYGQLKALRAVEKDNLEAAMGPAQGLLPLIYLYAKEDVELLSRNEAWMAAQNRLFTAELAQTWVKSNGNDAAARHLAAQLLASVGSAATALELEPTNELALLRQAISAEKGGLLAEATAILQTLVKAHPESAHGRLRLGVVMRRQGQEAEAVRLLTEVMNEPTAPHWVAGLACQQLADLAHEKGQRERAEQILRDGIDKIGLQSLYLQLAFYLDERQRPDEAVAVLNGMTVTPGRTETSGRHSYNAPPEAEIAAARQQVEARVASEWPQLRAALRIAAVPQQGSR
ncbi:MAG TPA: tetratricopeptide repeat protein [Thermoanaerobaculia bacterium]|jgi:tetratricopeptide (TPR) repeat protein|nr:tetratricopeptide repeat protein [Thermoanaerobaculia bacterium]